MKHEKDGPARLWIDKLNIPPSDRYAGTYYLDDDDDHETIEYNRLDPWQPIETAPKDVTEVLVWEMLPHLASWGNDDNFPDEDPQWFDNSYDGYSIGYSSCPLNPTHWMPLPAPPKTEGKT